MRIKNSHSGFTIVELLIVIVVIGILAAITIVAYTGISQKAIAASLQSDLSSAATKLKLYQIDNMAYPTALDCAATPAANTICLKASPGNSYSYFVVNNTTPQTFSLTATSANSTAYVVTDDTSPVSVVALVPVNLTFASTGAIQTWTVVGTGTYKLEVWGAQGGCTLGGYGGYSYSTETLTTGTVIKVVAGGQGICNSSAATYGGGGGILYTSYGGSGGGASVIGVDNTVFYAIAGGGGGGTTGTGCYPCGGGTSFGGHGGGGNSTGGSGTSYYTSVATGGLNGVGGTGAYAGGALNTNGVGSYGGVTPGYGVGGGGTGAAGNYATGGGGGGYGGGGGSYNSSSNGGGTGGGGGGYAKHGGGTTGTNSTGNGYAKITSL